MIHILILNIKQPVENFSKFHLMLNNSSSICTVTASKWKVKNKKGETEKTSFNALRVAMLQSLCTRVQSATFLLATHIISRSMQSQVEHKRWGMLGKSVYSCVWKKKKCWLKHRNIKFLALQILVSASVFKILYQSGSRRHLQPHQRAVSFTHVIF